jgi:hypothetical protein
MASQVVAEFEVPRGFIRATVDEFRGKRYASIRLWVEPRDLAGADLIPTSKGLSVPIEYTPDLLEACQALAAAAPKPAVRRKAAA